MEFKVVAFHAVAFMAFMIPIKCCAQGSQVELASSPELCTMRQLIKKHKIKIPEVRLGQLESELRARGEKCKPREFYVSASRALIEASKLSAAGQNIEPIEHDPFPVRSDSEQYDVIQGMSSPEICTIHALTISSGITANGVSERVANRVLRERKESCNPESFYQSIAVGMVVELRQIASNNRADQGNGISAGRYASLGSRVPATSYDDGSLERRSQAAEPNDVCNCKGYSGPGGVCFAGPGGPAFDGPGGPAYRGPGGPCYAGAGGSRYAGPGGDAYDGPGGPRYSGPGGAAYDGPGGPAYSGPGGACYAGAGGPCYSGPGGTGQHCPAICK